MSMFSFPQLIIPLTALLTPKFDVKLRGAYDLQLAEVAVRQMRGVPATWVLPLEKALGTWLTHTSAMEQDMTHGHYISRTYHQSGKMEVWVDESLNWDYPWL